MKTVKKPAEKKKSQAVSSLKQKSPIKESKTAEKVNGSINGKTFLFTGTMANLTRSEAETLVKSNNGAILSGVSDKLNYLVVGEDAGSKLEKAKKIKSIKVLKEKDFLKLFTVVKSLFTNKDQTTKKISNSKKTSAKKNTPKKVATKNATTKNNKKSIPSKKDVVDFYDDNQFGSMQVVELKSGYQKVIPINFLGCICQENEFIYLNDDKIGISYNMDISDMYGSPFGEGEDDYAKVLSIFEDTFLKLKNYFSKKFEIVYFTYDGEYTANMWSFDGKKLKNASGWIGDLCDGCEEDSERDAFVDKNYPLLKSGSPTFELLDSLRSMLVEV